MQQVVDKETATADIHRWLDAVRIKPSRRELDAVKDVIETLAESVQYGEMTVDESGAITQKLIEPIGGDAELKFAFRIQVGTLQQRRTGMADKNGKVSDTDNVIATLAALCSKSIGEIKAMDQRDFATASNVAVFFL